MNHDLLVNLRWTRSRILLRVAAAVVLVAAGAMPAAAVAQQQPAGQQRLVRTGLGAEGQLRLEMGRATVLETEQPVTEVSVSRPEVADINLLSPTRILVTARTAGATQLVIFADDQSQVIDVSVEADIGGLRAQLSELFPAVEIHVQESRGRLVLRGEVPNLAVAEQMTQVAAPYGEVLNFLEVTGGQQIMLQVVFAEVSRTATTQLGVNFGVAGQNGFGGSNVGNIAPLGVVDLGDAALGGVGGLALGVPDPGAAVQLFGVGEVGDVAFAGFLQALRDNNLMRVLARPNLVAISGETASFLAGGEFPIPVTQTGGAGGTPTVTIEFREFGVRLEFVAVAMGDGRIRLKATPEVSDIDFANAVQLGGFLVPGLTQRRVNTTVELADGQSLAIAGLLDNRISSNKSAVPVLGDLPVLGALFRSVRYQRRETELVVFVTPRLVSAMNPAEVPAVPGQRWDHPTEAELFFLGRIGRPAAETGRRGDGAPLFYGPYGFNRAQEANE